MISVFRRTLAFMTRQERFTYSLLLLGRCLSSVFDLASVLAVGYLGTSIALFVAKGSSPSRSFTILGFSLPAVNIKILPGAVALIVILVILKAIVSVLITRSMATHLAVIEARAARSVIENTLGGGLERSRALTPEELLYSSTVGTSSAFSGLLNNFSTIVSEGFMSLGLLVTFLLLDPFATLVVLIYFGLIAYLIQFFVGSQLAKSSRKIMEHSIKSNAALSDLISSFRELAVMGKRTSYFNRIQETRTAAAVNIGQQLYLASTPRYIIETAVLVGVMAFGGFKLATGDLANSVTTLGVFFTGSMRIMAAMLPWQAALINIKQNVPQAQSAHGRLSLTLPARVAVSVDGSTAQNAPLPVVVSNLCFKYANEADLILEDVSFEVKAGSQVAFIGASGAGKSTLADLLMGLLEPESGTILFNGKEPAEQIRQVPGSVAYVPQKPGMLSGTIAENVSVGDAMTDEVKTNILYALDQANLLDVVSTLKAGIDTDLGNAKDALSGGQMQRLGLARALYCKPSFLLMDEATSALDANSEHVISQSLEQLRGKVTVVLIAHRLNTVKHADAVFYFDSGRLVDVGTFKEIVSRNSAVLRSLELSDFK